MIGIRDLCKTAGLLADLCKRLCSDMFVFFSLVLVQSSLPPARYKDVMAALLAWLQQCENKLAIPSTAVTEYPVMEQRLKDIKVWDFTEELKTH